MVAPQQLVQPALPCLTLPREAWARLCQRGLPCMVLPS